ncbi:MAG: hypothetical protein F9K27_15120 [Anaerolineae bacterium]|nr:MAG: hypothetical protein F9K27_15120 [Anaerolineae bacterium]
MTSFYPTNVLRTIVLKYRTKLTNGFIIGIGIILCALQVNTEKSLISPWRVVDIPENSIYPGQPPALFEDFILWHPFGEDALNYYHFSSQQYHHHDWLRGTLNQWSALFENDQIFLVWRTQDNRLWVALLSAAGEQLTAPILISSENITDFRTTFIENNLVVLWQVDRQLKMSFIDGAGRSHPAETLMGSADDFALEGKTIVWRENDRLYVGELTVSAVENKTSISAFTLQADESLTNLHILLNETHRIILWGKTQVMRPDVETYTGVLLPKDDFADLTPFQIMLPNNPPLRWATVSGKTLVMAAYLDKKWQPIQIDFGENGPLGFQIVSGAEVLASPPTANGSRVAWATLDEKALPRLYLAALDIGKRQSEKNTLSAKAAIMQGLKNSYRMLGWLILPLLILTAGVKRPNPESLALASYWLSKMILPFGMFDRQPDYFSAPLNNVLVVLLTVTLIALITAHPGWNIIPVRPRWAIYFLIDSLLTFAILGAAI